MLARISKHLRYDWPRIFVRLKFGLDFACDEHPKLNAKSAQCRTKSWTWPTHLPQITKAGVDPAETFVPRAGEVLACLVQRCRAGEQGGDCSVVADMFRRVRKFKKSVAWSERCDARRIEFRVLFRVTQCLVVW